MVAMENHVLRSVLGLSVAVTLGVTAAGARATVATDLTVGEPHRMPGVFTEAQIERRANAPRDELDNVPGPAGADHWFAVQRIYPFKSLDIGQSLRAARSQADT